MYLRLGLNKIFILLNLVPGKFGMISFWNTVPLFPLDEYLLKLIHKIKELDLYMKYLAILDYFHCFFYWKTMIIILLLHIFKISNQIVNFSILTFLHT